MIIAVDVDNTVAELATPWLQWYNKEYDQHMCIDDWTDWDIEQFTPVGTRIYDFIKMKGIYANILPERGARDGIARLKDLDARIIYVTHSTEEVYGEKYFWLKAWNFIQGQDDYIECKDKTLVRADVLIDDNFRNVHLFNGLGILFDQPWNGKYCYARRMFGWSDIRVIQWIIDYIEQKEN
jgi:5'-nucleotidase